MKLQENSFGEILTTFKTIGTTILVSASLWGNLYRGGGGGWWGRVASFSGPGKSFYRGEGALPLVQLSISFLISCVEKHSFYSLFPTANPIVD